VPYCHAEPVEPGPVPFLPGELQWAGGWVHKDSFPTLCWGHGYMENHKSGKVFFVFVFQYWLLPSMWPPMCL
jgi:hypothetical protein